MGNRKVQVLIIFLVIVLLSSLSYVAYTLLKKDEEVQTLTPTEREDLLAKIESRDSITYRDYLKDGRSLSFTFKDGKTPLEKLIYNNDFSGAKEIIETGFDLKLIEDIHPVDTITGIIAYNEKRDINEINEITVLLIEQIKDEIDAPDEVGYSLLINTIVVGNRPAMEAILEHIDDVNQVYNGHTALSYAAYLGTNLETFQLLVEHGADLNQRIDLEIGLKQVTPIMVYIFFQGQNLEIVEYLVTHSSFQPNLVDSQGLSLLHYAVANEQLEIVEILLNNTSIDKNLKSKFNMTAYELAIDLQNQYGESTLYDEIAQMIATHQK